MKKNKYIISIFLLIIVLIVGYIFVPRNFEKMLMIGNEDPTFVEVSSISQEFKGHVSLDENKMKSLVQELKSLKLRWTGRSVGKIPVADDVYRVIIGRADEVMNTEFAITESGSVYLNDKEYKVLGNTSELIKLIKDNFV